MQGIGTKIMAAFRLAAMAGLLSLHGCALLESEPEVVEPAPEVFEVPEPVVEKAEPMPEPQPPPVKPALPPAQVAIVLSSRQEAYADVATELSERLDVPYKVVINEAVALAKKIGATDSHKYINGVLDKAARHLRKAEVEAAS